MKVALIRSIFGGFDEPKEIMKQSYAHDSFLFSEKSGFIFRNEFNPRFKAKYFKYQQHHIRELREYDAYIYIDGSFLIKSENFIEMMVRHVRDYDLAITLHNKRDCLFDEVKYIVNDNGGYINDRYGDEKPLMLQQAEHYRAEGMPTHWGLFCGGLFARKNTPHVNAAMDSIWLDNVRYASQDQNPLPFYCWKNNLKVNRLKLDIVRNHFWELKNHA